MMKETIHRFGKGKGLVGTLTCPGTEHKGRRLPASILWNAGMIHRAGPFRLNVDLARSIAGRGFYALRFDITGKGDSKKSITHKTFMQLASENLREAMHFLSEKEGIDQFILIGLCSGADQLHSVAMSNKRVTGAVFLDGYGYRTGRYYFHKLGYYGNRISRILRHPGKSGSLVKNKFKNSWLKANGDLTDEDVLSRPFPRKEIAKNDILKMIRNGKDLLFIYTGGVPDYYNYRSQFEDMFKIKCNGYDGRLQVEFFKEANHTYTFIEDRAKMIRTIIDWLDKRYNPHVLADTTNIGS